MRSRILIGLLAGTIGGFLGWLLQENLVQYTVSHDVLTGHVVPVALSAEQTRTLIFCVGGLIGLFLGAVDGVVEGSSRKLLKGMGIGALAGIVLGFVGFNLGAMVYNLLGGSDVSNPGLGSFAQQVIARTLGWSLMGLGLGVGASIPSMNAKKIARGAFGGFLGGFLGGFIFDMLAIGTNPVQAAAGAGGVREVGGPSRMVGFTAIGGLTGFFIGLVEELLKQAWVKVLAGRNEGKDFILTKPMNILGRDERCDVPLYGDVTVGLQHAAIRADGPRHVLIDAGTPAGTVVNGQQVPPGGELLLRDGDMIQIGAQRVLFREKATQNKFAPVPTDVPKPASPVKSPMPSHLCPYCGGAKDAAGNCLCSTVGNGAGVSAGGSLPPLPGYDGGFASAPGGVGTLPASGGYGVGTMQATGRLVGLEGAYAGQVFALANGNMVGREVGRDIVLSADATVSRTHARLALENGNWIVYDNSSANGTFVNGQRVTIQPLAPGDVVQFGNSKFRFE